MKVLFLTNIPSPYRVDFFNELGKICDLTVLFERKSAKDRNSEWVADKLSNFKAVFLKGIKFGAAEAICPGVIKFLSNKRFDVIVVGMYSSPTGMLAIEYMKTRKIPFILNSDGGIIKDDSGFRHKIKEHFIGSASAWLSTGKMTTKYLTYYGADSNKICVYPFTSVMKKDVIDRPLSEEEKRVYKNKLGMMESKIVLSVGQFIHRKGYDLLLKSCKSLDKNIGVYIVGGKATEEYLALKKDLNLNNVYFIDFMKKCDLAEYYKAADLFVLPTREDIWGLVINEAIANGLPVLTTDKCVAGLEIIKDNGNICSLDTNWAKEIMCLLKDENKDVLKDMSFKSLKIAETYSTENMAQVHYEFFERYLCNE